MLHSTTWTGMRTLADDYREADIRRARVRGTDEAATATRPAAPGLEAAGRAARPARPLARMLTLLPRVR